MAGDPGHTGAVAQVIFHAGMAKAGSTTVQRWIGAHASQLRDEFGIETVVLRRNEVAGGPAVLERYEGGEVNSGWFLYRYEFSKRDPSVLDEIFDPLAALTASCNVLLISAESFGRLLVEPDEAFVSRLEAMTEMNEVRVVYYVRPQHTSLEAAWRQWGFRLPETPAAYVEAEGRLLDYFATLRDLSAAAPNVSFEPRLMHRGVLGPSGIVGDFARSFLGIEDVSIAADDLRANPGLPLELAIMLREAPEGMFWSSSADNSHVKQLKNLYESFNSPASARIRRSRQILQHYCRQKFELHNGMLIDEFAWPVDHLVPSVSDAAFVGGELEELNELWAPDASSAERGLLYLALSALLGSCSHGKIARKPPGRG